MNVTNIIHCFVIFSLEISSFLKFSIEVCVLMLPTVIKVNIPDVTFCLRILALLIADDKCYRHLFFTRFLICVPLIFLIKKDGDLLGCPVDKTLCSQCRGPGFNPWSGNLILSAAGKTWSSQIKKYLKKNR